MSEQCDFDFERTHARRTDPATSRAAAKRAEGRAGSARHRILCHLRSTGRAMSWEQLSEALGLPESQCWKRCSDLKNAGLIRPVGTTTNKSGAQATLYAAVVVS